MTEEQTSILETSVPMLRARGGAIAERFYQTLLGEHPELRPMFSADDQESGQQAMRLAKVILAYVSNLRRLDSLSAALFQINERHVKVGVAPEQYPLVGDHLVRAVSGELKEFATPVYLDAWRTAYDELAARMIDAEARMYQREAI